MKKKIKRIKMSFSLRKRLTVQLIKKKIIEYLGSNICSDFQHFACGKLMATY